MLAATDVADLLVKQGVPFREAHGIVAGPRAHARWTAAARSPELSDEELAELAPALADPADFRKVLVERRVARVEALARAAPSLDQVRAQLARARALVA